MAVTFGAFALCSIKSPSESVALAASMLHFLAHAVYSSSHAPLPSPPPSLSQFCHRLYGSYEALKGGRTSEAMEDFTGGVVESYDLPKANDNLFEIMAKAAKKKALMSCSIKASPGETEAVMANGLVKGHAYSVTGAREVCVCVCVSV